MIQTNQNKTPTEINEDWIASVKEIVKHGNVAEVKRERENIVVIEISRLVKNKTAING